MKREGYISYSIISKDLNSNSKMPPAISIFGGNEMQRGQKGNFSSFLGVYSDADTTTNHFGRINLCDSIVQAQTYI